MRSQQRDSNTLERAFLKHLTPDEWGVPFFQGTSAGEGPHQTVLKEPVDVVLYLVSTDCPKCSSNLNLLNQVAGTGVRVFGIAVDSISEDVQDYQATWGVEFPIFIDAAGAASQAVPRYGTPTTVVISDRRVALLDFGELDEASEKTLRELTDRWKRGSDEPSQLVGTNRFK